jgi:hypothetical protein
MVPEHSKVKKLFSTKYNLTFKAITLALPYKN